MYLTVLGGVRSDWTGNVSIVQLASQDLVSWEYIGTIDLDSPRVTDPAVSLCGDGQYRLWYKDEARGSNTYSAVSGTPAIRRRGSLKAWPSPGGPMKDRKSSGSRTSSG